MGKKRMVRKPAAKKMSKDKRPGQKEPKILRELFELYAKVLG